MLIESALKDELAICTAQLCYSVAAPSMHGERHCWSVDVVLGVDRRLLSMWEWTWVWASKQTLQLS